MATQRKPPANVYQELLEAVQRLARANAPKAPKAPPRTGAALTAVVALTQRLAEVEKALQGDLVSLARKALDTATTDRSSLLAELDSLKRERCDQEKRRRELADAAANYDWGIVHKDKQDFIGPLTLDHSPERSKIMLGRVALRSLDYPSGSEVFEAVMQERTRLEADARTVWPTMRNKLLPLQQAKGDAITWKEIVAGLVEAGARGKKNEAGALFALVMLRQGVLDAQWSIATRPPALAQQRESIILPRIDKPGAPDKVFAFKIEGPAVTG